MASFHGVPLMTLFGELGSQTFDPSKFEVIEDTILPLGCFYFSSDQKRIIKKTPRKWKLAEVASIDRLEQVMLWNLVDDEPQ